MLEIVPFETCHEMKKQERFCGVAGNPPSVHFDPGQVGELFGPCTLQMHFQALAPPAKQKS